MADFWRGVTKGGKEGWDIGSAMATKKGDRKRKEEDELKKWKQQYALEGGYEWHPLKPDADLKTVLDNLSELRKHNKKDEAKDKAKAAKKLLEDERRYRDAEREKDAQTRRTSAQDLRDWHDVRDDLLHERSLDVAADKAKIDWQSLPDDIKSKVAPQAPSLLREGAPSLPYGKDELGYAHPFGGSPELIEDVAKSLREQRGEISREDHMIAAAKGGKLEKLKNALLSRQERMFEAGAPKIFGEAYKLEEWMPKMPTEHDLNSVESVAKWGRVIEKAQLGKDVYDIQGKVKEMPPGMGRLSSKILKGLPEKELLHRKQMLSEAFDAQTFKKTIDQEEKQRAAWARGTEAGAPKTTKPLPKSLKPIHGFNKADEMVVALVMNTEAGAPKPTAEDYNAWINHFKIMGIDHTIKQDEIDNLYGVKEGLPNLNPPPQQEPKGRIFRNDAEIKAAISAGQLAVGDSYTYIDPRTGEEKIAILEEE